MAVPALSGASLRTCLPDEAVRGAARDRPVMLRVRTAAVAADVTVQGLRARQSRAKFRR